MKIRHAMLASVGVLAAAHSARADAVSDVLGCQGNPCVVRFSAGGEIGSFKAAAREINRTGRRVIIDGLCLSACAVLADEARGRVCVTPKARFGFHKGYVLRLPKADLDADIHSVRIALVMKLGEPEHAPRAFEIEHRAPETRGSSHNGWPPSVSLRPASTSR